MTSKTEKLVGPQTRNVERTLHYARLLLVVLLVPLPAMAQAPPPPPPRFEAAAEASFVATSGNTETTTFGLGGELFYRPSPWVFRWKAALVRTETEDTVSAESFAQLFRAERAITRPQRRLSLCYAL
jgi:hypothetical protein